MPSIKTFAWMCPFEIPFRYCCDIFNFYVITVHQRANEPRIQATSSLSIDDLFSLEELLLTHLEKNISQLSCLHNRKKMLLTIFLVFK